MEWGKMRRFWSLLDPQFAALGERVEEEESSQRSSRKPPPQQQQQK
jgi:hypothetical protein